MRAAKAVSSSLDLQTVLSTIVTHAVQLSSADAGTIYEFDESAEVFVPRANYGLSDEAVTMLRDSQLRMGDGAACAKRGQKVPDGYYNLERMLRSLSQKGGAIGVCGTCMDARGITEAELAEGAKRSTLDELTTWTAWADTRASTRNWERHTWW